MIKADGLSLTVRDSVISDSANYGYGIKISSGSLDLTGTRLTRNAWGVYLNTLGSVTVKNNCFAGNAYYGLYNKRTDMTVDATLNWWGDPSGPRPLGTGDYAYDAPTNLAVSPWLEYDPTLARPTVSLDVPESFEICLPMTIGVESPAGLAAVHVYADGREICDPSDYPPFTGNWQYTFNWLPSVHLGTGYVDTGSYTYEPASFGPREVRVVAVDVAGKTGEATRTVSQSAAFGLPVSAEVLAHLCYFDLIQYGWECEDCGYEWMGEESPPSECRGCHRDPATWVHMRDWTDGSATYNDHTGTDFGCPMPLLRWQCLGCGWIFVYQGAGVWPPVVCPSCEQAADWLFLDADTQVRSCRPGTVTDIENERWDVPVPGSGDRGNYVGVAHGQLDDDLVYGSVSCHLLRGSVTVTPGQTIATRGHPVVIVGMSGDTDGPHVHLKIACGASNAAVCVYDRGLVEGPSWYHTWPAQ